jgi:hypothetical protein
MTRRRFMLALVFTAGLGATLATIAAASSLGSQRPPLTAMQRAHLAGVNFVNGCTFSHSSNDDPIVFPAQPGRSHQHTFVGNRTTNAFSTVESLLAGASTCDRAGHTAAYWMPSLVVNGSTVMPRGATVYYRRRTLDPVRAFPPGFRMIAGDAAATQPQGRMITFWNCGPAHGIGPSAAVPSCPPGRATTLRLHVTFPSCWDGNGLDGPDHKSHVRYPTRGRCPATHPLAMPAISLIYRYPQLPAGAAVSLSSGGQFSAHADFFNAWNQATLQSLVDGCLNALRHCGRGN